MKLSLPCLLFVLCAHGASASTIESFSFSITGGGVTSSGVVIATDEGNGAHKIRSLEGTYALAGADGFSGALSMWSPVSVMRYAAAAVTPTNTFYTGTGATGCDGQSVTDLLDACGVGALVTSVDGTTHTVTLSVTDGAYLLQDGNSVRAVSLAGAASNAASVTPEPSTWLLTGTGFLSVGSFLRRRFSGGRA